MKQTAVEWLITQLEGEESLVARIVGLKEYNQIVKQAKQMEKEQIKDAWLCGQTNGATICTPDAYEPKEKYYNETYNK
jgi:hypothetical protein